MKTDGIKITADAGKLLTKDGIYSACIFLGKNDSVDNWKEVDESEEPTAPFENIDEAKQTKIDEIEAYYNSDEINLVSVQGADIYLDPDTRFKLAERLTAAKSASISTANITLHGNTFNLSVADAEAMLNAIVLQYAAAYDIKEAKIKEVNALTEIADAESYNVKSNYPPKLIL